jgi:gluconolactonase
MRHLAICVLLCVIPALVAPAPAAEKDKPKRARPGRLRLSLPIVPKGASLGQPLYTRSAPIKGGLTEGPAVARDGSIYFTDIPNAPDKGLIVRYDPKTGKSEIFTNDSGMANGLFFDRDGNLIACEGSDEGGRRVSKWNVKTKERTTLADRYQGKRFNAPNDLCIDRQGRIYFTDPRYLGTEPRELEHRAVYRIDVDGTVVEVTHDISKPNGIALSPDDKTLYVADHDNGTDRIDPKAAAPKLGRMAIDAFPLGDDGLVHAQKRTIVDFGDQAGCDGMCVDRKGNLYLTVRSLKRPGVMITDPHGKEIGFIPTGPANQTAEPGQAPKGLPSNVEFGIGPEKNTLYVTVDLSLYRIRLNAEGFHAPYEKP